MLPQVSELRLGSSVADLQVALVTNIGSDVYFSVTVNGSVSTLYMYFYETGVTVPIASNSASVLSITPSGANYIWKILRNPTLIGTLTVKVSTVSTANMSAVVAPTVTVAQTAEVTSVQTSLAPDSAYFVNSSQAQQVGNYVYYKVTTGGPVSRLFMSFYSAAGVYSGIYFEISSTSYPELIYSKSGNVWIIRRQHNAVGDYIYKFSTKGYDFPRLTYIPGITAKIQAAALPTTTSLKVGTTSSPTGTSVTGVKGQPLYYEVTTSADVSALYFYCPQFNLFQKIVATDSVVVSKVGNVWTINRPFAASNPALTVKISTKDNVVVDATAPVVNVVIP